MTSNREVRSSLQQDGATGQVPNKPFVKQDLAEMTRLVLGEGMDDVLADVAPESGDPRRDGGPADAKGITVSPHGVFILEDEAGGFTLG